MFRNKITLLCLILVIGIGPLSAQDVFVTMNVANQIVAGTDVRVEVRVVKSELDGFARFQQDLPLGITAKPGATANADFNFEDQRVNLIWLKIPAGEEMEFGYTIHPHETVKGEISLGGRFHYILNEERSEVNIPPRSITITPSPNVDPSLIVDIADFKEETPETEIIAESFDITCFREVPFYSESDGAWIVNILLSRGDVTRLARIEEQIPEGFSAENIDNMGSIFSFKSGIAKFLWMQLPDDPVMVISYKLVPPEGQVPEENSINGTFTFMEGDISKSIPIVEKRINLTDASPTDLSNLMATLTGSEEEPAEPVVVEEEPVVVEEEPVEQVEEVKEPEEPVAQPVRTEPQEGIIYKVQVRASRKPLNIEAYFRPYGIVGQVSTEYHEGWHKYTTGSFTTYREARESVTRLINQNGLKEAFVVAYSNGNRIAVKRALELTNQVWFR
jgi:hypothetical protein